MAKAKFEKQKVPAYMTSFADMMTIVLTFFILLYSYSSKRNIGAVQQRAKAFDEAIKALGLPGLLDSNNKPVTLGKTLPKFPIFPGYEKRKNAKKMRDLQSHLPHVRGTEVESFQRKTCARIAVPIAFKKKKAKLNGKQKHYLKSLLPSLAQRKEIINVKGYAEDECKNPAHNLKLALERALNTMKYLHKGGIPWKRMRPVAQAAPYKNFGRKVELNFEPF